MHAIRAYHKINLRRIPVGEAQGCARRSYLGTAQGLAEIHPILKAGEENRAQRRAVHLSKQRWVSVLRIPLESQLEDLAELLIGKAEIADIFGRRSRRQHQRKQVGRQASLECTRAKLVNGDPVSLAARLQTWIALIDADIEAGLKKRLGEAQAAQTCPGDGNRMWSTRHADGPLSNLSEQRCDACATLCCRKC